MCVYVRVLERVCVCVKEGVRVHVREEDAVCEDRRLQTLILMRNTRILLKST